MEPGRFGPYGGKYIPETLMSAIQELEVAYTKTMLPGQAS